MVARWEEPDSGAGVPDRALVRRVLDGDREAYSVLVLRHQDGLFRYARGMGVEPDPARDLVQDAFVDGYRKLGSCRDPGRFEAWIFRILRNRCLDYLKDVRRRSVPLDDVELTDDGSDPAADAVRSELRDHLRSALSGLSAELRDAFLMKHLEGFSYAEISEVAGASVSAVKMRVHRAREALRNELEARGTSGLPDEPRTWAGATGHGPVSAGRRDSDVTSDGDRSSVQ